MNDIQTLRAGRVALLLLLVLAGLARAHGAEPVYPVNPIRVILPVPAGGTSDVAARTVTQGQTTVSCHDQPDVTRIHNVYGKLS